MIVLDATETLVIREPREAELPLCRMLLPDAAAKPVARHFRLAFLAQPTKLVAALSYRDDASALGGVRLHVVPPHRRIGIGSRLLEYAAAEARRLNRDRILADADLHTETAAEPFLLSHAFRKAGTITFAEIELADLRASMEADRERLQSAVSKLPPSAQFVGLTEAPMKDVTRLYAEHISHMQALAGLGATMQLDRAIDSVALVNDGRLAGFVLARVDARVLHIPAWVVVPEFRRHGIGFALLQNLAERVRGRVDTLRFEFTDVAMATPGMLNVPGCRVTKIAARFVRSLTGS